MFARPFVPVLAVLGAAAALAAPAPASAPAAPPAAAFERFFTGATEGSGSVQIVLSGKAAVRDRSRGRMDKGALLIDQVVEQEGEKPRRRSWRLVRSGASGITGTISDVKGAVTGQVNGSTLHLKYRMAAGPSVDHWITLQPGGRTAVNKMTFHRFGMKVATVQGTIRKVQ